MAANISKSVVKPKVSKAALLFVLEKTHLDLVLFVLSSCNCFPETGINFFVKISTASFHGINSENLLADCGKVKKY